ncbi:hypothetical protein ARGLB_083_00750 [Arthrobacter globiformis NBRC 12137]|uniref:DUF2630 domain-containing protein n=1 Tax=Arthrobacter globiformis (strain ATCC 8010 / DSM 20124 / JCM 1332 / NBRC 12137 / NCIMB 8907 / NRRL B-2979 / 168) TaxID=1077972 RepID=H0QQT6_ARTG1|nr:DUF2630 family protein [Arthrobacter globiformis]GAB15187.1 hypothetical protein ARGLB_083_00750 [Arthrobacter globiformis NBRC 12137]
MDDQDILQRIQALVDEEHQLRERAASGPAGGSGGDGSDGDGEDGDEEDRGERRARLRQVEEALDQCWDLLRQRRAKAKAGEDPNEADARPVNEVEGYVQ